MMNFRIIKDALITILEAQSAGNFQTRKSQKKTTGATESLIKPRVTFYYQSGNFPKSSNSTGSDRIHEPTYKCEIQIVSPHKIDLNIINNPTATPIQVSTALTNMADASDVADDLLDETFDNVYQILMNSENIDLGLDVESNTDLWIESFQKDNPVSQGEFLILTGSFNLMCRVNETVLGEIGISGTDFNNNINLDGDPNNNMGTSGNLGG